MAHAGMITKGTSLSYKKDSEFVKVPNLVSYPEIGGDSEKVETTNMDDGNRTYTNGIKDYGDGLEFGFLFDNSTETSNYRICRGLEEAGEAVDWQLAFPDGTKFNFSGEVTTKIAAGEVGGRIDFSLVITLASDMAVVNPQ